MADVAATFRSPFAEQVAAFRLRLGELVPTSAWDDIRHNAHDRAFMVAGAMKADLLADLAQAVDKSIAEGRGLEEFRRDFRANVEKHGWHGWTGEGSSAGEAWRTRVIYRTNAATTYSAGRLAQLREAGFKYYVYRHGGSAHPRLHHLAWDGLILPADHPFWDTHFPPNGWGCSCYVIGARSIEGARRVGGDPSLELEPGWEQLDPKTGTPEGIGRGWDYAPGSSATDTILSLRDKLDVLPERPSIDLIQNWIAQGSFWDWFQSPTGAWPLVRLTPEDAKAIGSERLVADLTAETARQQLRAYPDLTAADYALVQQAVGRAARRMQDSPRSLTFVQDIPGESGSVLVVKAARRGEGIVVTDVRRMSRAEAIRDPELQGLLGKGE